MENAMTLKQFVEKGWWSPSKVDLWNKKELSKARDQHFMETIWATISD